MLSQYSKSIIKIIFFKKKISNNKFKELEIRIKYTFKNKKLLEQALTHKSLNSNNSYERLEFLGDSLLNIIISDWLFSNYPNDNEGSLTKKRAQLVNKEFLELISKKILLRDDLIIGNSINSKQAIFNILADVFESILGAIYIDGSFKSAKQFVHNHLLENINESKNINKNYKGILIEKCHTLGYPEPFFKFKNEKSKNRSYFEVDLTVNNQLYKGTGNTKKNAEINAAKIALETLREP